MGIVKCRERAAMSVWWPKISANIKERVAKCRFCLEKQATQRKEPLMPTPTPERLFQHVAADICEEKGDSYLVTMDYYSKYINIAYLPRLTSAIVIDKLKGIFDHHGIPEVLVTDNGMQFASDAFAMFAKEWNFVHKTSSPTYPQSNGRAESGVKIAKPILAQPDPFLALLSYRATPIPALGKSPAELAHGRKIRTTLPMLPSALMPYTVNPETVHQRGEAAKQNQKFYFDKQHGARPLPELQPGNKVLIKKR
jgi:transposase InsO family protein